MTGNDNNTLTLTTPTEREIVATRVFDAPRTLIFESYTTPERMTQWMLGPTGWTMPVCEIDLRPGGRWHFVWRRGQTEMAMNGVYREVVPPERIVTTESWGGDWPDFLNTLQLSEVNGKTTLTTTLLYPTQESRDAVLKTGMKEGMAMSFDRLADQLKQILANTQKSDLRKAG